MYKKGLSSVVATTLIVLLTVTAAIIIAGYVIPLVENNLKEGTECFEYKDYFYFEEDFGYNCYNDSLYAISVGANFQEPRIRKGIKGFRLAFTKSDESNAINVEEGQLKTGEIRMLNSSINNLIIPKSGEVRTYVYQSPMEFQSVKIYPLLKSGRVCDENDFIKIDHLCRGTLEII